jgi:hypothetical protein
MVLLPGGHLLVAKEKKPAVLIEFGPPHSRSTVAAEIRRLIREVSIANPLWGAPRIHGELLKLGIEIGQTSVA